MKMAFVMIGVPGSGKSTYLREVIKPRGIASADSFFTTQDGEYNFDPTLLPQAHQECVRKFLRLVQPGATNMPHDIVAVDNTNASPWEIAPYVAIAEAHGYEVALLYVECDPGVAAARNVHAVPEHVVGQIHARIQATLTQLPPWYKLTRVRLEG